MGLNAVLKDRARIIEQHPQPVKVEGRTQTTPVYGAWFRVRLQLPGGPESADPGGKRRTITAPTLLVGARDSEGNSLTLPEGGCVVSARHQLRILSAELGDAVWQVTAKPNPIRKRKRVIGYEISVARVDDAEFTPRLP